MVFNVQLSWQLLWASLVCGAAFGVLYDVLRFFRAFTKNGRVLLFFHDISFCLLFSAAMCVLYFNYSNGRIRLYALLAACSAFAAYRLTLGAISSRTVAKMHSALVKLKNKCVSAFRRACRSARRAAVSRLMRMRQLRGAGNGFGM